MIICGLPNEERAEKIQDIALYIINQKTEADVGRQADFKGLVVRAQCITERHIGAGRVTGCPSSQRVCTCVFCRAWPDHLSCAVGKGNGPWHTMLEKMIMMIFTSCWRDKSKLSCSWKSGK